jgi:hypothetical protein
LKSNGNRADEAYLSQPQVPKGGIRREGRRSEEAGEGFVGHSVDALIHAMGRLTFIARASFLKWGFKGF